MEKRIENGNRQVIEFTYSGMLKKYIFRTKGIQLKGRGIIPEHDENNGPYNVYKVTKAAFRKLIKIFPDMPIFEN